jgi:probable phosphoglycerate mutase
MTLPTIYLARHGETEWSRSGRHTGRTDIPLTAKGEDDGRRLKERLAGIAFAHVFSSPLARARRTAELAGFEPRTDDGLLEWNYGAYDGMRNGEIQAIRPGWNLFRDGCPDGESPAEVAERADRLVSRLANLDGNVICFAHGHILRVLAARWVRQPVALAGCLLLGTASLSILAFDHDNRGEPVIRVWNS